MRDHLSNRARNVFHILLIPQQKKLRQPDRYLVGRALRYRAAAMPIIDHWVSIELQLRKVIRIDAEQIATVDRLVKAPIAGNAFAVERRYEQVTRNLAAPITKYVVINRLARKRRLRRKRADTVDLRQAFAQQSGVPCALFGVRRQLIELAQQQRRLKLRDAIVGADQPFAVLVRLAGAAAVHDRLHQLETIQA